MIRAEDVKQAVSITNLIQRYGYTPNRAGFISCPFHLSDDTPSLKIYADQNTWHCFGCARGGSVIDWIMHAEGLGFSESLNWLAGEYHLSDKPVPRQTRKDRERRRNIQKLRDAEDAQKRREYQFMIRYLNEERDWLRELLSRENFGLPEDIAYWQSRLDYLGYIREVTYAEFDSVPKPRSSRT